MFMWDHCSIWDAHCFTILKAMPFLTCATNEPGMNVLLSIYVCRCVLNSVNEVHLSSRRCVTIKIANLIQNLMSGNHVAGIIMYIYIYIYTILSKKLLDASRSRCGHDDVLDDMVLLFFYAWVINVYFNCKVQDFLYHDMDLSTMQHCTLLSCTPTQSIGLVLGCALPCYWVSLCVPFTNSLIQLYLIRKIEIIGIFAAILFISNDMYRFSVAK